ncbi:hypothetical protein C8R47DRAFT_1192287 [Mycena vitilis]|nr:hypothetical protein C8R47DRAFT_1192287 [Mycena vitilis]
MDDAELLARIAVGAPLESGPWQFTPAFIAPQTKRQNGVERVEYVEKTSSQFPIFRHPTPATFAYGELRADSMMFDKNQDSWRSAEADVDDAPACLCLDREGKKCRRSRNRCRGCVPCNEVDLSLEHATRPKLDPPPRAEGMLDTHDRGETG